MLFAENISRVLYVWVFAGDDFRILSRLFLSEGGGLSRLMSFCASEALDDSLKDK